MRNARADHYFDIAPPVLAIANDYARDIFLDRHEHQRDQLLYAATGTMILGTTLGKMLLLPGEAAWIPSGMAHDVQMVGLVSTRSLYLEPRVLPESPTNCRLMSIPPLVRNLLFRAVDLPLKYDVAGRDGLIMNLLFHELLAIPNSPKKIPIPENLRLATLCRKFLDEMSPHDTINNWSKALNISRRSFTRLFKRETGIAFGTWKRQVLLFSAMPRLLAGEPVTRVALDLGYTSPGAFTTMFRRAFGASPTQYIDDQQ